MINTTVVDDVYILQTADEANKDLSVNHAKPYKLP